MELPVRSHGRHDVDSCVGGRPHGVYIFVDALDCRQDYDEVCWLTERHRGDDAVYDDDAVSTGDDAVYDGDIQAGVLDGSPTEDDRRLEALARHGAEMRAH